MPAIRSDMMCSRDCECARHFVFCRAPFRIATPDEPALRPEVTHDLRLETLKNFPVFGGAFRHTLPACTCTFGHFRFIVDRSEYRTAARRAARSQGPNRGNTASAFAHTHPSPACLEGPAPVQHVRRGASPLEQAITQAKSVRCGPIPSCFRAFGKLRFTCYSIRSVAIATVFRSKSILPGIHLRCTPLVERGSRD
ncbi:hypothetical protein SAMN04488094_101417 [Tropicimonas isoalkanivorans]|uniref:Uncharacterized protein n=1 Tax=Tropicimonas isoalkanivorans TaxID=441112 RepID=A0A1I1DVU6_9RHOB|nr:hypothetical protein SAMN04488094_101417 [Tropicimonas isoalkanivorans]